MCVDVLMLIIYYPNYRRSDFDSDYFLSLMIEQGLSLDLYKSINRLSKSYRSNPAKISNDEIKVCHPSMADCFRHIANILIPKLL